MNVHKDSPFAWLKALATGDSARTDIAHGPERPTARPTIELESETGWLRLMRDVYRVGAEGMAPDDIVSMAVQSIARIFNLALVFALRKHDNGAITVLAASREDGLWAEMQRLPERWDGTVVGNGPAGKALQESVPVAMRFSCEGLLPWRAAAEREGLRSACALPLALPGGDGVLELFSNDETRFERPGELQRFGLIVKELNAAFASLRMLERQRLLASALECAGNAVFITDVHGTITWANRAFSRLSGYPLDELIGRNPRILHSGHQGLRYYRDLWSTIRAGKVWSGETVDRARDGRLYTIRQTVTPVALQDRITHYVSIHQDISTQKAEQVRRDIRVGTDETTGLLTRAAFDEACQTAMSAPNAGFTLVAVSLRDFQRTAAAMGRKHEAALAASAGERILDIVKFPNAAGLSSPGEFLLLLQGETASEAQTQALLERLRIALTAPYPPLGEHASVDFRAGIACYPRDGDSIEALANHTERQLADEPLRPSRRRVGLG